NGDEVIATLVYEKLERHCSKCFRLDHELRDCLQAKAEKRQLQETNEKKEISQSHSASSPGRTDRSVRRDSDRHLHHHRETVPRDSPAPIESNYRDERHRDRPGYGNSRSHDSYSRGVSGGNTGERDKQPYNGTRRENWRLPRPHRPYNLTYREVQRPSLTIPPHEDKNRDYERQKESRDRDKEREAPSNPRSDPRSSDRGIPLRKGHLDLPQDAVNEAIEELREVMGQYSSCADPTESAARKERFRLSEESGELEETAIQMVQAALTHQQRPAAEGIETERPASPERVPALLRLGPSPTAQAKSPPTEARRKPGRPPGKRRVNNSPKTLTGAGSRKRKLQQTKPTAC
ncbi:unnamed protein product, partial [Brassica napus]